MKTFLEALQKARIGKNIFVAVVITIMNAVANALILVYLADIFNEPAKATENIIKVFAWCMVTFVCPVIGGVNEFHITQRTYISLLRMYTYKIITADYALFTKYSSGHVISVGTSSLKEVCRLPRDMIELFINVARLVITAITMIVLCPSIGVYVVGICTILLLVSAVFTKKWWKLDTDMDNIKHIRTSKIEQSVSGFAEIRSFYGAESRVRREVLDLNTEYEKARWGRTLVDQYMNCTGNAAEILIMFVAIFTSINLMQNEVMLPATAITLVTFAWRLVDPINAIIGWIGAISVDAAPLKKIHEFMEFKNTVHDGHVSEHPFKDVISFNNVGFSYPDAPDDVVLENVSFSIKKGERIGICGPSGGGKTSLLKLIPRFYDVTKGSISIDGIDIKNFTKGTTKKMMGIVHQDPYIFDSTIGQNIKFARQDYDATDEEVVEACKKACIYDFIMSLPNKFDTNVGPRGLKLSGGQKQRIALARIFLQDPDIIILDEATSALDNETERIIQESINNVEDKTLIVIAHRLSTIRKSDKIIVVDNHTVAESGTHKELMSLNGRYAQMVKSAVIDAANNY